MDTQIMVPGILVALKTSVYGGTHYDRRTLEEEEDGSIKRWETVRTMEDPKEHEAALEAVGKASRLVSKLCVRTSFGYLCPIDRERDLDGAIAQMRTVATDWNQRARHSFINVVAVKGRIADNDEDAVRAILQEANELLDRMDKGLSENDVKLIRDAAQRAKNLSEMMTEDTSDQITAAVAAARQAARAIVKRGEAIGDKVANAIIETEQESFAKARFAFLDTMEATVDSLPSVNLQRGAELEIEEATS
jgi:hypothetical protein